MAPGGAAKRWKSLEKDGAITASPLAAALAIHGVAKAAAAALFAELDLDGDGEIDMDEWLAGFGRFEEVAGAGQETPVKPPASATSASPKKARATSGLHSLTGVSPKQAKPKALAPLLAGKPPRRSGGKAGATGAGTTGKTPGAVPRRAVPRGKAGKAGKAGGKAGGKLKKAAKAASTKVPKVKELTAGDRAAMSLQCALRQRMARHQVGARRAKLAEWEAETVKVEAEAARMIMERDILEYRREQEKIKAERERDADRKTARKNMMDAAFDGENDLVLKILGDTKILVGVDDCDENGNTALSEAAGGGHAETCLLLLEKGADPNIPGQFKRVPLWRATFGNHVETARTLLTGGADYRLADRTAMSSLLLAKSHNFPAIVTMYESWDLKDTEKLVAEIAEKKERELAAKKAEALSKTEGVRDLIKSLEKESLGAGRQLRNARVVLERRITEYDTEKAGLAGLVVPPAENEPVHLKGIQEAEMVVEKLAAEAAEKKEKLEQARFELRESERIIAAEAVATSIEIDESLY